MELFTLYGIKLNATVYTGITGQDVEQENEVRGEMSCGQPYPSFLSLVKQGVKFSGTSLAVGSLLGAISPVGAKISAVGPVYAYAQKIDADGTRATGDVHRSYSGAAGIIYPKSLTIDDKDAKLTLEAIFTSDGTNHPLTITDSIPLPALGTDAERFGLGPCKLGGVSLPQVSSVEIDFGLKVERDRDQTKGIVWDEDTWIQAVEQKITIRGTKLTTLAAASIPLTGKAATHANTEIYLRKRDADGIYVAAGSAVHGKLTACGLAISDKPASQTQEKPGELSIVLTCRYDGTNAPILFTTSAIT